MSEGHSFISATMAELNRRKVLRTVGAYAVGVFVLLQLMDAAVEPLRLPDWIPTLLVIVLILGFPIVFLLAWHLELRSDGIYRTARAGLLSRAQSALLFGFMLAATAGLAYLFFEYYSGFIESGIEPQLAQERSFAAPENSIAVLPFTDLSQEGNQTAMADGISEEILNLLAQVDGLHVAARTSSFAFRDSRDDIRKIGRLLNVRTVLEGSVRTSGDRVRLTAQLINVEDGFHIWSKFYDRKVTDLFEIQDEVASNIAESLVDSFDGLESKPATRTDSLAAAQAYRTGRLHWWRRSPAELQKAIELFANSLEHDAGFAPAYAAMADTWLLLAKYGNVRHVKATEKAQAMIEKALAIDPQSAEAFAALGLARWQIGQYDAAESALRHAIDLNEDYIPAHLWLSGVLAELGRYPEQIRVLEKAMSLDPLNELLAINYASTLSIRGDWEKGRRIMQDLIDVRPDSTMLLRSMALISIQNGDLVEGWTMANRAYQLEPDNPEDISALAQSWVYLGDTEQAERLLADGLKKYDQNANLINTYWMTLVAARRYEEAARLVHEERAEYGENPPAALDRTFNFQLGLIAIIKQEYEIAYQRLAAAVGEEDEPAFESDEFLTLTLASLAAQRSGHEQESNKFMEQAKRKVKRARLNGMDSANIYYAEASLSAMQDEPSMAIDKLRTAYDRGFRELWILDVDGRLDRIRNDPEYLAIVDRMRQDLAAAHSEVQSRPLAAL